MEGKDASTLTPTPTTNYNGTLLTGLPAWWAKEDQQPLLLLEQALLVGCQALEEVRVCMCVCTGVTGVHLDGEQQQQAMREGNTYARRCTHSP